MGSLPSWRGASSKLLREPVDVNILPQKQDQERATGSVERRSWHPAAPQEATAGKIEHCEHID
jgi:hypothetical protein